MIEVPINDGKYTLVYDPARNDKLVAVKRNGEPWLFESQINTTLGYSNWLHAVLAELTGPRPNWAGQFDTFDDWVNHATRRLTGRVGSVGEELRPICVDTLGRRCHVGKDFMRARDEGTFPVRYFWDCER